MKKFLCHIVSLALLAALLFSVLTGNDGIMSVVASAYWVLLLLVLLVSAIIMAIVCLAEIERDPAKKAKSIKSLEDISKRNGAIRRAYNWLCLVLVVSLLAYGGWVFTAVCYAVIALIFKLCTSIARDKVNELSAA
jgi:Na+/melibiose symporter-like transporter